MNFLEGFVNDGTVSVPGMKSKFGDVVAPAYSGQKVTVGMRAEHLMVNPEGDTHTVELTESLGGVSFVYLTGETGERIVIEERGDDRSSEGDRVGVTIDKSRIYLLTMKLKYAFVN